MPYVQINTNKVISDESRETIARKAAELITVLSGKKPERTMVAVNVGCQMLFGNSDDPCASVAVELFKHSDDEEKKEYCEKLVRVISEITEIEVNRIYMIFTEHDNWVSEGTYRK